MEVARFGASARTPWHHSDLCPRQLHGFGRLNGPRTARGPEEVAG
jgi:hypothetical protein